MHESMSLAASSTDTPVRFAALVALTPEARDVLRQGYLVIDRLPFRVGRECRVKTSVVAPSTERRHEASGQLNDLYISESATDCIARRHFQIDQVDEGFVIVDRGSRTGTTVGGRCVAAHGGRVPIRDHDLIIVGPTDSPFVFRFRCD